jgi:hypothetical protein
MTEIFVFVFGHCIDMCINTYVLLHKCLSALQRPAVLLTTVYRHTQNFSLGRGGAKHRGIYYLCLILETML